MLSDEKGEYLVHIANIYPLKNQSYAIDLAYAMGLKLILIGDIRDKAYYDLCLNKAQEKCVNIEHVGFLDNSSITFKRIVAEAKFTIIPSFNEVLPLVAFESLMLGTQVICTNNCSIDDYLDYECGVLTFDPLQPASNLVQEATKFLEYPHDFHVIQNLLSHEYSWDGVADKLISIYEKLLSR
jgi:glycosyltransferase involved in cell wall biosynthesis